MIPHHKHNNQQAATTLRSLSDRKSSRQAHPAFHVVAAKQLPARQVGEPWKVHSPADGATGGRAILHCEPSIRASRLSSLQPSADVCRSFRAVNEGLLEHLVLAPVNIPFFCISLFVEIAAASLSRYF